MSDKTVNPTQNKTVLTGKYQSLLTDNTDNKTKIKILTEKLKIK